MNDTWEGGDADGLMNGHYVPSLNDFNLSINGIRVKSSGEYMDCYEYIDIVARCAAHTKSTWSFHNRAGIPISY